MSELCDPAGAFCPHGRFTIAPGRRGGPLAGQRFAAKDLYDVEGHATGAGSPDWLSTHAPAAATAPAITRLLEAGATLVGKTHTDELAYSINGDNLHYGTPLNTLAPQRFPGGSSSGSAAAVAARSVDFALGTDTGGSVRIPASFCGLVGMRTSHGRIAMEGVVPLMPSYDTVGWFTSRLAGFEHVGDVLLGEEALIDFEHALIVDDALDECDADSRAAVLAAIERIRAGFRTVERVALSSQGLEPWRQAYRQHSAAEAWRVHGRWITEVRPAFAPAIRDRFAYAAAVSRDDAETAGAHLKELRHRLRERLAGGTLLLMPTAPGMAPLLSASAAEVDRFRGCAQRLTCIATIGGLAELSVPAVEGLPAPLGLSLVAAPGRDRSLIRMARRLWNESL
jgi:amidase